MSLIGFHYISTHGFDTTYEVVREHPQPGRVVVRVRVKYPDGSWHVTNERAVFRTSHIDEMVNDGRWQVCNV